MYIQTQYDKIKIGKAKIVLDDNVTIVENIDRVIDYIQEHKVLATKARQYFAIKEIQNLNNILLNPLDIISARPAQKTYPNINGIYLLLRTMGILRFDVSKKEIVIEIDDELLRNWKTLNKTEQYFMLLEFWLIQSYPKDTIEASVNQPLMTLNEFFRVENGLSKNKIIEYLSYIPQYYNLALCEMFGFVDIETEKPIKKNSWNIVEITVKPLVKNIFSLFVLDRETRMMLVLNPPKLGYFQKIFHPHFKEFENILEYPKEVATQGVYRLKISLGKVYRTIDIDSSNDFEFLATTILEQFDFDCDHLYQFIFFDNFGRKSNIQHYHIELEDENSFYVNEYYLNNFPLKENESFKFIFDFGNLWEFNILIEKIDEDREIDKVIVVKSQGKAPEQYPDYDEEW